MAGRERSTLSKRAQQRRESAARFALAIPKSGKRSVGVSTTAQTPMHIRAPGVDLDPEVRDYTRARVSSKLGKFGLAITRISVRFEDVSGPMGAPLVECQFKVVLRQAADVLLSGRGETTRASLDQALASAERAVRRTLEKGEAARKRQRAR
jgi:Sigma 54 modulation protein / S30EA ribosomal protein